MAAAGSTSSAPSSGEYVVRGEVAPASVPSMTRTVVPSTWTGSGTWWSNARGTSRASGGSATHSWTPWSVVVPGVDTSECATPWPAVIRFSSPGRTVATTPTVSRCWISPVKSQLTVCSPVCGCGGTSIPPVAATSSGP